MSISRQAFLLSVLIPFCGCATPQPMMVAVENGRADEVRALLDKGVNPNGAPEWGLYTPLGQAAYYGNKDIVKLLLDRGAEVDKVSDVDKKDSHFGESPNSMTPLADAARRGHAEIAEMLISRGADIQKAIGGLERFAAYMAGPTPDAPICELCDDAEAGVKLLQRLQPKEKPPAVPVAATRCRKNADCKDDRICVERACVQP